MAKARALAFVAIRRVDLPQTQRARARGARQQQITLRRTRESARTQSGIFGILSVQPISQ